MKQAANLCFAHALVDNSRPEEPLVLCQKEVSGDLGVSRVLFIEFLNFLLDELVVLHEMILAWGGGPLYLEIDFDPFAFIRVICVHFLLFYHY